MKRKSDVLVLQLLLLGWLIQGVKLTNTECRRECKSRRKIRIWLAFVMYCILYLLYSIVFIYFMFIVFCIYCISVFIVFLYFVFFRVYLLLWNTGASNYCFLMFECAIFNYGHPKC